MSSADNLSNQIIRQKREQVADTVQVRLAARHAAATYRPFQPDAERACACVGAAVHGAATEHASQIQIRGVAGQTGEDPANLHGS